MKICNLCGNPIPGKSEDICYFCWMGHSPEESKEMYENSIKERTKWLLYLKVEIDSLLNNKALRVDSDLLYTAYSCIIERKNRIAREATCTDHDWEWSCSGSHSTFYECSKCGATDER